MGRNNQHIAIPAGARFGSWTVVERVASTAGATYVCRCDCGRSQVVKAARLRIGRSSACRSCAHKDDFSRARGLLARSRHPLFNCWSSMHERCYNPSAPNYRNYGGRGIRVCDEWHGAEGFWRFVEHMGPKPTRLHSIDRIDNDGSYEPCNVRWATSKQQGSNRRTNRPIEAFGRVQTIGVWAAEVGLHVNTIDSRMARGWPVEAALTMSPDRSTSGAKRLADQLANRESE